MAETKEQKELQSLKDENKILTDRLQVAEGRVKSLVEFAKATFETNADLLAQIDGAVKSNRKLHNIGGQNLQQFLQVLDQENK